MNENLNQPNMITPNEPQKKNNGGIIAIVIIIVLIGIGAFLILKKDNEPVDNKKTETKEESKKE